jgi:ribosomal protein S18 acetylase RimI-like enzyme
MAGSPPPPHVRRAREEDASEIAAVVVDALSDKYGPALGRAAVRGVEGLVRRDIREGTRTSRYWVAEVEGRVAGGVHLMLADERGGGALRALAAAVGWPRALRAVLVFSLLGSGRVARDEGYIDELGVADWARRRGVASALLSACEREARRAGKRRLTLWVTFDNDAARPLYERYGFREARRRRWVLGRLVFGAPGAIFMEMSLPPR